MDSDTDSDSDSEKPCGLFPSSEYILTSKDELPMFSQSIDGCYCFIFSRHSEQVLGRYDSRAAVLMQMRFDGHMGFPGAIMYKEDDLAQALNRELVLRLNLDVEKHKVQEENYVISHHDFDHDMIIHFYALEVPMEDFKLIERRSFLAEDFGTEVMGNLRVPLFTMEDGYRGFPSFLANSFAGNSRQQLLHTLVHLGIMSQEEIDKALKAKPN